MAALFKPAPTLGVWKCQAVKIVISVRRLLKHLAAGSCAAAQQTKANTEQLGTFLSNNKLISLTPGGKVSFRLTLVIGDSSLLHTGAKDREEREPAASLFSGTNRPQMEEKPLPGSEAGAA